jgi:hypothetical protein
MNHRILPSPPQTTLFVSRETSNCPLLSEIIHLGHRLQQGVQEKETGVVSMDYAKRLLINAKNSDIKKMTQQDIVEIVDYDPLKNILMVIGPKDPALETSVHWIIQKARQDINVLVQIDSVRLYEQWKASLPTTEKETPPASLERAKEILKTLRNGKTILLKNQGILFVGFNSKEIYSLLDKYLGEQK